MSAKDWIPENYVPQTIDATVATAKNLPSDAVRIVKDPIGSFKEAIPSWKLLGKSLLGMETPYYKDHWTNQIPYTLGALAEWVPIVGEYGGQQLKRYGDALNALDALNDNDLAAAEAYQRRARERNAEMITNYALMGGFAGLGHLTSLLNKLVRHGNYIPFKTSFTTQPTPDTGVDPNVGYNYKVGKTEPFGKRPQGNFGITGEHGQKLTPAERKVVEDNFKVKFPSATPEDITAIRNWEPQPNVETRIVEMSPNDIAREASPFLVADAEDLHNMMSYINHEREPSSPFPLTLERVEKPLEGEIVDGAEIPFSNKPVPKPAETAYPQIEMSIGADGKPVYLIAGEGQVNPSELLEARNNYEALLGLEAGPLALPNGARQRTRVSKTGYDPNLPQSEAIVIPTEGFSEFNRKIENAVSFPDEVLAAAEKMDNMGFIDQLSPQELQDMVALQTKRMNDYRLAGEYDKYKRAKAYRDVMLIKREERRIKRMDDKERARYVLENQNEYNILQQRLKQLRELQNGDVADVQHRYNVNMTDFKNKHHVDEWNKEMARRYDEGIPYESKPDFVHDELSEADRTGNTSIHEGSPTGQRSTYNPNDPADNAVPEGSNIILFNPNNQFNNDFKAAVKGEQKRVKENERRARADERNERWHQRQEDKLDYLRQALDLKQQYKELGQLKKAQQEAEQNTPIPFKATWNREHAAQITGQRPELKSRVWGISNKYFPESHKRKGIEDAQAAQRIDIHSAPWTVTNEVTKQILGWGPYGEGAVSKTVVPLVASVPTTPLTTTARSVGKSLYENLDEPDMVEGNDGTLEKDKTEKTNKFDGTKVIGAKKVQPEKKPKTQVPFKPAQSTQPTQPKQSKSNYQMLREKGLI